MDEVSTDRELIASSITHPDHFGVVFDRHYDDVRRFAWRRLGPAHADDIAAEVFARAFDRRSAFDPGATDARPWLFGIASNLMRMHARGEKRKLRAYARSGVDPFEDFSPAATERASADAGRKELLGALASLKRVDREVVLLFAWAELTTQEIADALMIPHATVRTKLARARKRLADELGDKQVVSQSPAPETVKETS